MSRTCTVCLHPEREEIDKALVAGEPTRKLAARYGPLSRTAVQRHADHHLPAKLVRAAQQEDAREGLDALKTLRTIHSVTLNILKESREEGDPATALRAIDRVQRQIELSAKLLGELDERPQVNLYLSPEWLELRAVIVGALEPHPEARGAVLRAIERADN